MARGKKAAAAAARRASTAEETIRELREQLKAERWERHTAESLHAKEVALLRAERLADVTAEAEKMLDATVERRITDAAERLFSERERELKIANAQTVSLWMRDLDVRAPMEAWADLADRLNLGRDGAALFNITRDTGDSNRNGRRAGVTRMKMLADQDRGWGTR